MELTTIQIIRLRLSRYRQALETGIEIDKKVQLLDLIDKDIQRIDAGELKYIDGKWYD